MPATLITVCLTPGVSQGRPALQARPTSLTAKARLLRVGRAPGVLGLGPAPSSSVPHGEEALALALMLSREDVGRQRGRGWGARPPPAPKGPGSMPRQTPTG